MLNEKEAKLSFGKFTRTLIAGAMVLMLGSSSLIAQNAPSKLQPLKDKADDFLYHYQIGPALDIYKQIIAEDPKFANCHYNMAICYNQLKQFDKAYSSLEKFVTLKPNDSEAFFNMGIMKVYLGDDDKARALFLKARALHPSRDIKRRIKDALDHLQPSSFPQESLAAVQTYLSQNQS